jgi:hypothetical protein
MSLACEPNATYEYVLRSDKDKPVEKQPAFIFSYVSARRWKELCGIYAEFDKSKTGKEGIDKAIEFIHLTLVGWKNIFSIEGVEIPFAPDKLADIVSMPEVMELREAVMAQGVSAADKKKLDLLSPSGTDSSAKTAPA